MKSILDERFSRSLDDLSADESLESGFFADRDRLFRFIGGNEPDHSDSHVEHAVSLGISNVSGFRDQLEDRRSFLDRALVENRIDLLGRMRGTLS